VISCSGKPLTGYFRKWNLYHNHLCFHCLFTH